MEIFQQLQLLFNNKYDYTVAFDNKRSYSSNELQHHLRQCIQNLSQLEEESFLLFADNSYDFVVNFLALIYLNKNITLTANNQPEWLESINSSYDFIISSGQVNNIPATHYKDVSSKNSTPLSPLKSYHKNIRFYTSGSSDKPKAISKNLEQLLLEVVALEQTFGQDIKATTFLATVSHQHIYGLIFKLLWPLIKQRTFYAEIVLYPEQLVDLAEKHNPLCLISSPAFLSRQDHDLPNLQLQSCFSSGSLLSKTSAESSYQQLGIYPIEIFGSTETGGIGYRTQQNSNSLWTFFSGVRIKYKEEDALLESPYLTQPHKLDDRVELLNDNQFKLLGRKDRVVKIEEKRVSLNSLETALAQTPWVKQAKVVVLQQHRTFIAAVVELNDEGCLFLENHSKYQLSQQLKEKLKMKFEAVAIPRKWRYCERLPYNSQGKLPVSTLMELFV